jgi:hypothetical protein
MNHLNMTDINDLDVRLKIIKRFIIYIYIYIYICKLINFKVISGNLKYVTKNCLCIMTIYVNLALLYSLVILG